MSLLAYTTKRLARLDTKLYFVYLFGHFGIQFVCYRLQTYFNWKRMRIGNGLNTSESLECISLRYISFWHKITIIISITWFSRFIQSEKKSPENERKKRRFKYIYTYYIGARRLKIMSQTDFPFHLSQILSDRCHSLQFVLTMTMSIQIHLNILKFQQRCERAPNIQFSAILIGKWEN